MKTRWKKSIMVLIAIAVLTSLCVVPARAATCRYSGTFYYCTQDELTNQWIVVATNSMYNHPDSTSTPNDYTVLYLGYNGAPSEFQGKGYTYTTEVSKSLSSSGIIWDTWDYTVRYLFTPVTFRVTYKIDGNVYQEKDVKYGKTETVLSNAPSKAGYTFNGWSSTDVALNNGAFTMPAANVVINGSYSVNSNSVAYQYSGFTPQDATYVPATGVYTYGTAVWIASAPTAPGYTFSGWSTNNAIISGNSFAMPDNAVILTGSWTPRTDTPYTVEFYKQDAPGNLSYTKQTTDTISSTGTTDTQIRAALNLAALNGKYAQYSLTDASKNDATTISGNGGSVLRLYYDKTTANVSYLYTGSVPVAAPVAPASAERQINTIVSVAQVPTLAGYDFSGWTTTDAAITGGGFAMPWNDVTLTGSWTPRTDTPYTVEFYQQNTDDDGYTLADTDHCIGTTDAAVTAPEKSYTGFTVTPGSLANASSTKIAGDGTTTVKLYYDRNINAVTYGYASETDVTPPALPTTVSYRYGQTVPVATAPTLPGYDFGGWETADATISNGNLVMPDAPVTFTGAWKPRSDTPFTVEFYQQNTDDNGYTLADTTNCTGTTGSVATLPGKNYPGFAVTTGSLAAAANVKIKSDGSSTVKLYYDRHVNTVTYSYSNGTDATPPALPETVSYRYGQTVSVDVGAPVLPGYDFSGWETTDAIVTDGQFTMPDAPVALIGAWTPRSDTPFTVEYYQQNATDDGYTLADTFHGEGSTGGGIPHKEFEGYTETPDSVTAEGSFKIKSDGTGILKLYFDRAICSVTYAYTGETDATPPALPETFTYRYGQTVSVDAGVPVLPGYEFSGWKTADVEVTDGQFSMPDKPVTFTGTWKARSDVAYTVEFYQQNIADDGYTLADTFHGEGTAGGNIPLKEFEGFLLTPDSVTAAGSFKIRSDGTATLKLYYDREHFTVTYAYAGRASGDIVPEDAPALPETASYRYGQTVTLPAQPQSKTTLRFLGWALDGTLTNTLNFALEKDVTITGYWYTPASSGGGGDDNGKAAYSAVLIPDSAATDIVLRGDSSNRVTFLEPPEKDGCTFAGWATESGGDAAYHAGDTITLTRNCVFYAVYYRQIAPYIIGFKDDTFRPCSNLTLKQGALMLNRLGVSTQITSPNLFFTRRVFLSLICTATGADIRSQDPVALAAQKGWIIGFKDGTLRPDDYITRAQAATILDRVFRQGYTQVQDGRSFADIPQTHWANEAISRASASSTVRV